MNESNNQATVQITMQALPYAAAAASQKELAA
jgi:hypothetical protein